MLVDFEVENFRSYREVRRLSMVASSAKELPQNLIETDLGLNLVRTAVLYGANASGKSNLLLAMNWVSTFLEPPTNRGISTGIFYPPFALDRTSGEKPTRFRVRFLIGQVLHDYSISVQSEAVEEERLVVYPHGRPQEWLHRTETDIHFNSTYFKGPKQSLRDMTKKTVPLLAVGAAFGHPQLTPPAVWLVNNLRQRFRKRPFLPRVGSPPQGDTESTIERLRADPSFRSWVNAFLRHADLGIQGVEIDVYQVRHFEPVTPRSPRGPSDASINVTAEESTSLYFIHSGENRGSFRFSIHNESQGTRRLFSMLLPLYEILGGGELAVVDELDESLHPSLVREIIRAFHEPDLNPRGAQLVFTTHDTSLLSGQLFRRDQVWFTEKDASGATDLYSLNDIKGVREDESFERGYLRGRYGAIPFFGSFDFPSVSGEPAGAVP